MTVSYEVTVYRRNISRIMLAGEGNRWIYRVSTEQVSLAKAKAPSRSGRRGLAGKHRLNRLPGTNQYMVRYRIANVADYAGYVHGGTSGSYAPEGKFMYLPPGGPGRNTVSRYAGRKFRKKKLRFVAGQDANPWLDDACSTIARRYGAVVVGPSYG